MLKLLQHIRSLLTAIAHIFKPRKPSTDPIPLPIDPYSDTFAFSGWFDRIIEHCPSSLIQLLRARFCMINQHFLFISDDPEEFVTIESIEDAERLFVGLESTGIVRSITVIEPSKQVTIARAAENTLKFELRLRSDYHVQ